MDVSISQDELLATMARDFPKEYQISCLTVLNAQQARRIAELQRALDAQAPPVAVEEQ